MNIQQVQTIIADAMEKHNGIVKKRRAYKAWYRLQAN